MLMMMPSSVDLIAEKVTFDTTNRKGLNDSELLRFGPAVTCIQQLTIAR
jgi:hypothetical protein